jgi:hypothetical protein
MKTLVTTYTFNPTAKTITFAKPYSLEQMLLVTNVTTNAIIYNFADPAMGGSITGSVLTLDFDTTAMSAGDKLQIFVDDITTVQSVADQDAVLLLQRVLNALNAPQGYDKSLQRQRGTNIIESGTITTVGTVTTMANLSSVDTLQGRIQVYSANLGAWASTVRARIT